MYKALAFRGVLPKGRYGVQFRVAKCQWLTTYEGPMEIQSCSHKILPYSHKILVHTISLKLGSALTQNARFLTKMPLFSQNRAFSRKIRPWFHKTRPCAHISYTRESVIYL